MLLYKSFCRSPKTFYGVTFNYGDSKAVSGYINDRRFVCLDSHYTEPKEHLKAKVSTTVVTEAEPKLAVSEDSKIQKVESKKTEKQLESKKTEVKKEEKPAAKKPEEKKAETKDKAEKAKTAEKKPEVKKEEKKS